MIGLSVRVYHRPDLRLLDQSAPASMSLTDVLTTCCDHWGMHLDEVKAVRCRSSILHDWDQTLGSLDVVGQGVGLELELHTEPRTVKVTISFREEALATFVFPDSVSVLDAMRPWAGGKGLSLTALRLWVADDEDNDDGGEVVKDRWFSSLADQEWGRQVVLTVTVGAEELVSFCTHLVML